MHLWSPLRGWFWHFPLIDRFFCFAGDKAGARYIDGGHGLFVYRQRHLADNFSIKFRCQLLTETFAVNFLLKLSVSTFCVGI